MGFTPFATVLDVVVSGTTASCGAGFAFAEFVIFDVHFWYVLGVDSEGEGVAEDFSFGEL